MYDLLFSRVSSHGYFEFQGNAGDNALTTNWKTSGYPLSKISKQKTHLYIVISGHFLFNQNNQYRLPKIFACEWNRKVLTLKYGEKKTTLAGICIAKFLKIFSSPEISLPFVFLHGISGSILIGWMVHISVSFQTSVFILSENFSGKLPCHSLSHC